jgi:hypothetical protein
MRSTIKWLAWFSVVALAVAAAVAAGGVAW